ncbi:MAG: DUF1156 domain-containing protein [Deltaproteobacteria bacterium]|nr:DUF1156 domain-containing protein [Deltaproteobacteria bacterium]
MRLLNEKRSIIIDEEKRKDRSKADAEDYSNAIFTYLTLALGKLLDYNSVLTSWDASQGSIRNTFSRHAYAWTWDHAEGDVMQERTSYDWCISSILKSLEGISERSSKSVNITIGDAAKPPSKYIPNAGFDVIITDPPYYGNVQYAEISDFFYVWFKRTLKDVYPEALNSLDTPKTDEAVANKVRHGGSKLKDQFYESKMKEIFIAMNESLNSDGAFILWFAHKAGNAWSSTIHALLESGFNITALWGVRAEMERSLHISGKASLRTNIIMVCRKHTGKGGYIQDVLSTLESTMEPRLKELEEYGIVGPDFIMGAQAEALKAASQLWPLQDPEEKLTPHQLLELVLDQAVGYVTNYVTRKIAPQITGVDATTKFYVLARHLYNDVVPYDDARRLALACLGTTGEGDPVTEIALDTGLGKLSTESVLGARTKVLSFTKPVERYRKSQLSTNEGAPIIDHIHHAVALIEENKKTQAEQALSMAGAVSLDVLNALYQILQDPSVEKTNIQTLLLTISPESLITARATAKPRTPKITDYMEEEDKR